MGRRGPKPTPTPVLRLRGSWRAGIRNDAAEPQPCAVDCPDFLSEKAKKRWGELHPMLVGWGVMAKPYGAALALLSDALADWIDLTEEVATATDGVGPLRRAKSDAWKRALAALREFGMTPAAVTAIRKIEKTDADPFAKYREVS